jgi:histidinol-phosphate/aromatic aminotransferase/cobyric acid decarboxylase-like protein
MKAYVDEVNKAKAWFSNELIKLDCIENVYSSAANFVLVEFFSFEIKMEVFNHLNNSQIFVRNLMHSERLKRTLRFSIGTIKQMERVFDVLKSIN